MSDPAMRVFDARAEILAQIDKTDDKDSRRILLLMLGVMDDQKEQFAALNKKLDTLLADEEAVRGIVLNGHASTHHEDHDWIKGRRAARCEEACAWVNRKMEEEIELAKTKKSLWQQFMEGMFKQAGTLLVGALAALLGVSIFIK